MVLSLNLLLLAAGIVLQIYCRYKGNKGMRRKLERAYTELEFWKARSYIVDVRLDPESKHPKLEVSEDGRSTACTISPSEEAATSGSLIIVGTEGFKVGRHYWEVRVDDKPNWEVGVLTEDTRSKLKRGRLHTLQGEQYWSLKRSNGKYYPAKVRGEIKKYICFQFPVVGIYLDMGKGIVSFYDTLDMRAIKKMHVKTSKKLYPFFSPGLSIVCF
ncbi:hypothetical protein lerEdw1_004209 [Lerista edwardsae]|nr:hypothetical protein lerEdw1_004210 [Lerista edwardsae]KAJ6650730.1 hypothetical protein lerEdw1_004209 [Lerista edwardsae]